ncbi:E3 ubiquitin-protein ligase RNF34-like isoform X2 [Amphiura filiformis]|uniref:E3 ubiquitin-protein ligase RNF34-like isoform X2 n=1 Tax=Amphiura filiformis TaxID=82378 RepID=UPI003B212946
MGSGVGKPTVDQTTRRTSTSYTSSGGTSVSATRPPNQASRQQQQGNQPSTSVSNQTPPQGLRPSTSSQQQQQTDDAEMVCEACSANFTIFKRKYRCLDCEKYYCASCIHKEPRKCCFTCRIFEGLISRGDVMQMKLKDLRQFLQARNISIETCREKDDLVDLVTQHLGLSLSSTPQIMPQRGANPPPGGGVEHRPSDTSATSTDTIPITEPNASSTRPAQESTDQPAVHIYGETPLGPMRNAWNDGEETPEGQSEASPENSHGMDDDNEFPEIINIPSQEDTTTNNTSRSQQQTQMDPYLMRESERWYDTPELEQELSENVPIQVTGNDAFPVTVNIADEAPSQGADGNETSPGAPKRKQRASVSDIKNVLDIESLTIKQMKEILARNFVDYKGCVERYELEERVKRLFNERENFRQRESKAAAEVKTEGKEGGAEDIYDVDPDSCCKICMDAPIDCVLLECGHMVTCSKCGKRLAECPICRQYVVRAVHVFKS